MGRTQVNPLHQGRGREIYVLRQVISNKEQWLTYMLLATLNGGRDKTRQDKKFIKIWQPKAGLVQYIEQ